ncbi:MAG: TlpA family protein disulfide reductase [Fimbriimonadaceae bacterium]|nr:TlpA family protein disulfide reductase [Fimbriimonadaceae bacterium]
MFAALILAAVMRPVGPAFPPIPLGVELAAENDLRGKFGPRLFVETYISGEAPKTDGKVVLLDFWATWCGPCRETIPELNVWAEKFKDDLVIIGLSDETPDEIKNFMKQTPMRYHVATDPSSRTATAVGVQGIPHVLVISKDGIVRYQGVPLDPANRLTEAKLEQIIRANRAL